MNYRLKLVSLPILLICLLALESGPTSPQYTDTQTERDTVDRMGAYEVEPRVAGVFPGGPPTTANLDAIEQMIGNDIELYHWFEADHYTYDHVADHLNRVAKRGARSMITMQPHNSSLHSIVTGNRDTNYESFAQAIKTQGEPVQIRWAHEMNAEWFSWGQQPAKYKEAYRYVHDLVEGIAPNAEWVWCPSEGTDLQQYYPGDAYVDWTCMDSYNWGSSQRWSTWLKPEQTFESTYNEILSFAGTKPMMIGETGAHPIPGNKATWIDTLYKETVPNEMPKVRQVVYFHRNQDGGSWRLDTSQASLDTFRSVINSPGWGG